MTFVQNPTQYLPLTGGSVTGAISATGNVTSGGHIQGTGTAPTATAGSNAGTSPPAPVVVQGSTDVGGQITFGTGTTPAAGNMVSVTFATPWVIPGGGAPHVVVSASNAASRALNFYTTGLSPVGFILACAVAPAAGQGNTTYSFAYVAMG
jgi:hypothetical protein